ncbi:MAG: hypothetical protein PHV61_07800 [Limnochordia bacterium]|nr:hypothetical protein [Limnochordia bacterium]MDD4518674.1 hypothetical protein [Limnochordia bacterium]
MKRNFIVASILLGMLVALGGCLVSKPVVPHEPRCVVDEDFSTGSIDEAVWTVGNDGTVEVVDGELYVRADNGGKSSLALIPTVAVESEIAFDVKPSAAVWNGYGVPILFRAVEPDETRLWYLEIEGGNINLYSEANDGWIQRERFSSVARDVWYSVLVDTTQDAAVVTISMRDTEELLGTVTLPHLVPSVSEATFRIDVAGWGSGEGSIEAYFDNIKITEK